MDKNVALKVVRQCDWMFWSALFLMIVARVLTYAYVYSVHVETKAEIDAIATAVEGNPLVSAMLNIKKLTFIIPMFIIPASMCALYWVYRNRALRGKLDADLLSYLVSFSFFIIFFDALNNFSVMLGVFMR